ncbi:MAG: hypothetical protein ABL918_12575 [Chakrabartia sp.]
MPNFTEINREIESEARAAKNPHDIIRHRYLQSFSEKSGRNVVAYYSGWLQHTSPRYNYAVSINDEDKNGFMASFHQLDFAKGLDLILHTPGGAVAATESIIHYIRSKFGDDVRVFVPQLSMSGGTMIALSGKEIWMGLHSNLGPIDPQFGMQPAQLVLKEFDDALAAIKDDPDKIAIWRPILEQIPPTFLSTCKHAIDWSKEIGEKTLQDGMFKNDPDAAQKANTIVTGLTDPEKNKNHGKHLHRDECEALGLKIMNLESDQETQDAILSVHHAFMISLMNSGITKIVENHKGVSHIKTAAPNEI